MRKRRCVTILLMFLFLIMLISSVQAGTIEHANKRWEISGAEKSIVNVQAYRIFNPVFYRDVSLTVVTPRTNVIIYRIKPGDTLERIAFRKGCTTQDLVKINKLNSTDVTTGQILIIIQKPQRVESRPTEKAQPDDKQETELELVPEPDIDLIPKAQPKTTSKPDPVPSPKPNPVTSEPKPETQSQQKPVEEAEPKPDPAPEVEVDPNLSKLTADEQLMFNLLNQARAERGLEPLKIHMGLVKLARMKSQDMVDLDYFSHESPTYGSAFDMMKNAGITYKKAAENIAGNSSVEGAHSSLMNSSGHRSNILNSSFTHVGIGIVNGSKYGKIFTQMFIQK